MGWKKHKDHDGSTESRISFLSSWMPFAKSVKPCGEANDHASTNENHDGYSPSSYQSTLDPGPVATGLWWSEEEVRQFHTARYPLSRLEKEKVRVLSRSKAPGEGCAQQGPFSNRAAYISCPYRHDVRTGRHTLERYEGQSSDTRSDESRSASERRASSNLSKHLGASESPQDWEVDSLRTRDSAALTLVGSVPMTAEDGSGSHGPLPYVPEETDHFNHSSGRRTIKWAAKRSSIGSRTSHFIENFELGLPDVSTTEETPELRLNDLNQEILDQWFRAKEAYRHENAGGSSSGSSGVNVLAKQRPSPRDSTEPDRAEEGKRARYRRLVHRLRGRFGLNDPS
jgi:hypothetical protein